VAAHGVDGVVDQVGPDLVELAGEGEDVRQRAVVVAHHLDAVVQLVAEHGERGVEAVVHVEGLQRGPVHLRVLLGRGQQVGDAGGCLADLVQQAVGLQGPHGVGEPVPHVRGRDGLGQALEPLIADAGGHQRGCVVPGAGDVVVLQPVGDLVLAVVRLERRQGRCVPAALERLRGQGGDRLELVGGELAADHLADLRPHLGQHLPQPVAGAQHRRHRVVQLVREPGRHLAEGDEPLVPLDDVAGVGPLGRRPLQQVGRHGEPLPHGLAEVGRRDLEQAAVRDGPGRGRVQLGHAAVGHHGVEGARVGAAVVGAGQLDLAALHPPEHRERARQQNQEARGGRALGVDRGALRVLDHPAPLGQPRELGVVEVLEQEQAAQLVGRQRAGSGHRCPLVDALIGAPGSHG
jgi:hypothetical protein